MYDVIKDFTDLKDGGHVYCAGDTYPRKGASKDEDRIKDLMSDRNKIGTPLIGENAHGKTNLDNKKEPPIETPEETEYITTKDGDVPKAPKKKTK